MTMAEYILKILSSQLMVVFSWGFNSPMRLPNDRGLRFMVNGYLHQGVVEVIYNEGSDLFDIKLIKNSKVVEVIEGVYLDSLVDVIDYRVERVDNYKERVQSHYSF